MTVAAYSHPADPTASSPKSRPDNGSPDIRSVRIRFRGGRPPTDGCGEHLRVRQGHQVIVGIELQVGDANLGHGALVLAAERSRAQPYRVADPERVGQHQD